MSDFTDLCQRARARLLVDGAAVSLAGERSMSLAACTAEDYARLERTQHFHSKGATILARSTGHVVAIDGLQLHEAQWPEFCDLARRIGVYSILAIPIGPHPEVNFVLSLYSLTPRRWTSADITRTGQLARRRLVSMTGPLGDGEPDTHRTRVPRTPPLPRNITAATALIADQRCVSQEDATHLLMRLASRTGLSLGAVADAVIRTTDAARSKNLPAS